MYLSPVAFEGLLKDMHVLFYPGICMLVTVTTAYNGIYCLPVCLRVQPSGSLMQSSSYSAS